MLQASYPTDATAQTSSSAQGDLVSTLTYEARLRVNAAVGWLGHAVAGRCTLEQANDAVYDLLEAARQFQS